MDLNNLKRQAQKNVLEKLQKKEMDREQSLVEKELQRLKEIEEKKEKLNAQIIEENQKLRKTERIRQVKAKFELNCWKCGKKIENVIACIKGDVLHQYRLCVYGECKDCEITVYYKENDGEFTKIITTAVVDVALSKTKPLNLAKYFDEDFQNHAKNGKF